MICLEKAIQDAVGREGNVRIERLRWFYISTPIKSFSTCVHRINVSDELFLLILELLLFLFKIRAEEPD